MSDIGEREDLGEVCQRCGERGEDRRTLWHACFYAMEELGLPFKQETLFHAELESLEKVQDPIEFKSKDARIVLEAGRVKSRGELIPHGLYTLRVCKECRAEWMEAIKAWFQVSKKQYEGCGSGIFIRRNGATIEITEEEWRKCQEEKP